MKVVCILPDIALLAQSVLAANEGILASHSAPAGVQNTDWAYSESRSKVSTTHLGTAPSIPTSHSKPSASVWASNHGSSTLHWSKIIPGLFNATASVNASTAPVTAVSSTVLKECAGDAITSSAPTSSVDHRPSVITVTDKTTVTETVWPTIEASSSSTVRTSQASLFETAAIPTAASIPETASLSTAVAPSSVTSIEITPAAFEVPIEISTSEATSLPTAEAPSSAVSPAIVQNEPLDGIVVTQTAYTTTWIVVTASESTSTTSPAKESQSPVGNGDIDSQPIDQAYGKPWPLPMSAPHWSSSPAIVESTLATPVATTPPASGTAQKTAPLPQISPVDAQVSSSPPADFPMTIPAISVSGTTPLSTLSWLSSHPVPTIPIIPSLPYGHPPAILLPPGWRNSTLQSSHRSQGPTGLLTASSGHTTSHRTTSHHTTGTTHKNSPSKSSSVAKCTTTFPHAPTLPCTATHYASTTTLAVNCFGCVGKQGSVTPGYHENSVCPSSATVTMPISTKSVCAVSKATGVPSPSPSSSWVASGFVTSTSSVTLGRLSDGN